jgi:hypothetical protein
VRADEQRKLYQHVKQALHPADRERLEESNDTQRGLRFDGMCRALPESAVKFIVEGESSTDLLLRDLTALAAGKERKQAAAAPPSFTAPMLALHNVPRRKCITQEDAQLAKYRSEMGGEEDSLEDSFEDDATRHVMLLSDALLVVAVQGRDTVLEEMVPLEVAWVVPGDALIVAWPAGLLHLAVDEERPRTVATLPARLNVSLHTWQSELCSAIESRLARDPAAAARRQGCSVWLENGHLAIEERAFHCAQLHGESGLDAKAIESLAQQKPKKKVALKASLKNRLGFQ